MSWSEDSLHRWLAAGAAPAGLVGSRGHDAAVLARPSGRLVSCVDTTVEGVHYLPTAAPVQAGRKAAARALSDLAATAATPRGLLLALRAPAEAEERRLKALIRGVRDAARTSGADLVGGDLSAAPGPLSLSVTALGELPGRARPPGRDRARAGDRVLLTGPVGGSLLGRHLRIQPRLAEGRRLWRAGARALMDVSDGLAWDLHRLARAAGVRLVLEDVPLHPDARRAARQDGRTALEHGLCDGEDHELIACLPPARAQAVLRTTWARRTGVRAIGHVTMGAGLVLAPALTGGAARRWRPAEGGWRHGT